ncbi:hypothetical protein BC832DRAFT_531037 [Gaertneriomyces semiglobifer]|nr:hypothetical protein BC832DRAFT_531037 [Gaertneriomyces semiglobifer]
MGIKRELEEKRKENERLQNLWLEAQKKGLAEKEGRKAVDGENEFLRTRLNIQETVKEKTEEVVKAAREEALEHKQEAAKLYMELKKSRVLIEELREANTVYERQLIETRARLEETYVTSDTASQMLKGEIRRLQGDRAALRKARIVDEKSTNGLERKYVLAREMVEKLRKERTELMKANWELKGKVEELERFVARFQSSVAQTSSNANATPQRPPWASLVSTPGGNMDKAAREPHPSLTNPSYNGPSTPHSLLTKPTDTTPDPHTLPDIESWRLKIDTLTRERSYLLSESQTLRSTIASLQSQLQNLTTTVQSLYPLRDKYQQLKSEMQTQQQMMQRKLDRAHALCAGLERQLRDAAPNRKVEYRVVDGEVGSARLVAALITPVSTADRGMSGSGGVGSAGVGGGFGSMALPMLRSR